jgi:hypothetical protein
VLPTMTIVAILTFLFLCYLCGLGPTLLLMRPDESPRRLVVMPVVGLCAYILFALPFAQFYLTGNAITPIALVFFSLLAVMGYRKSRITRKELRDCAPAILLGLFSAAVCGWPLIRSGYGNYWGLANPDQAYLMPVVDWVKTHPFGAPPDFLRGDTIRGVPIQVLFAIYYVMAAVSRITTIPAGLLFNVTELCLVYMVPGSVYALSDALGLPRRTCITSAALIACSSLWRTLFIWIPSARSLSLQ